MPRDPTSGGGSCGSRAASFHAPCQRLGHRRVPVGWQKRHGDEVGVGFREGCLGDQSAIIVLDVGRAFLVDIEARSTVQVHWGPLLQQACLEEWRKHPRAALARCFNRV
eukprot:7718405-Pyramimonas_sp.AAC.1